MTPAVTLENVTLAYGRRTVVRDLSLQVGTGDFFVIIGPNGAGKTSLVKLLAGLERPAAGLITLGGRPLTDYRRWELSRLVAVVPQETALDFPFTVAETVLMGRAPHLGLLGMEQPADYRIAEQAMRFTEVDHLADRRLDQLSGGERQRVVIARALCQQPRVILLDEPTAALDPAHQMKVMDLMERFRHEQGVTVIMVSHDLNLAAMYGDRLLLMRDGAVVCAGLPSAVLTYELLEQAYGCVMLVEENTLGRVPRVTPVPAKYLAK
ncbi:MAG: ABC transporter [Deltaproteobacteria bacterium RIFOXYD12_FULL_57_12]|nr:MAG: ABC transporter [Deltaproteobacteria bacterium RIFOXYD12_FULL_57_12]